MLGEKYQKQNRNYLMKTRSWLHFLNLPWDNLMAIGLNRSFLPNLHKSLENVRRSVRCDSPKNII